MLVPYNVCQEVFFKQICTTIPFFFFLVTNLLPCTLDCFALGSTYSYSITVGSTYSITGGEKNIYIYTYIYIERDRQTDRQRCKACDQQQDFCLLSVKFCMSFFFFGGGGWFEVARSHHHRPFCSSMLTFPDLLFFWLPPSTPLPIDHENLSIKTVRLHYNFGRFVF